MHNAKCVLVCKSTNIAHFNVISTNFDTYVLYVLINSAVRYCIIVSILLGRRDYESNNTSNLQHGKALSPRQRPAFCIGFQYQGSILTILKKGMLKQYQQTESCKKQTLLWKCGLNFNSASYYNPNHV